MLIVFARTVIYPSAILLKKKVLQERATLNRRQVSVDNLGKRSYTDLELLCESNTTLSFVNTLKTNIIITRTPTTNLILKKNKRGLSADVIMTYSSK